MEKPVYQSIPQLSKRDITKNLGSNDTEIVLHAILSAALYSGDGHWAEKIAYKFIDHENPFVRGNALLALAHIARIHGTIDRSRAIDVSRVARYDKDAFVRGHAEDCLEEVQHWIKRNGRWLGQKV